MTDNEKTNVSNERENACTEQTGASASSKPTWRVCAPSTTAARITEVRKNAGLSQAEFAEKLVVTRAAVSKWESGAGMPSIDSCQLMAKEFGVSTDYILMISDDPGEALKDKYAPWQVRVAKLCFPMLVLLPFAICAAFYMASEHSPYLELFVSTVFMFIALFSVPALYYRNALDKKWKAEASLTTMFIGCFAFVLGDAIVTQSPTAIATLIMFAALPLSFIASLPFAKKLDDALKEKIREDKEQKEEA